MLKKASYVVLVLLVLAGAQMFLGCDSGSSSYPIPVELRGTWITQNYGDYFLLTEITLASITPPWDAAGPAETTYMGNVIRVDPIDSSSGYIIIQFTEYYYSSSAVGNYYVVYYENLSPSSINLVGASNASDPDGTYGGSGKATLAEAVSTYTLENEYFEPYGGSFTDYYKVNMGEATPTNLRGNWLAEVDDDYGEYSYFIEIHNNFISCLWYDSDYGYASQSFTATVNQVIDNNDGSGYLVLYIVSSANYPPSVGKYTTLYWNNVMGNTVDMVVAGNPGGGWASDYYVEATAELAKENLVLDSYGDLGGDDNKPLTFTKR